MKRRKLFIPGFIVAVGAFMLASASYGWAKDGNKGSECSKMMSIDSLLNSPAAPVISFPEKFQVFDNDLNLVYESSDKKDQKLNSLLVKSNFLTEINNSHIYQLSR